MFYIIGSNENLMLIQQLFFLFYFFFSFHKLAQKIHLYMNGTLVLGLYVCFVFSFCHDTSNASLSALSLIVAALWIKLNLRSPKTDNKMISVHMNTPFDSTRVKL